MSDKLIQKLKLGGIYVYPKADIEANNVMQKPLKKLYEIENHPLNINMDVLIYGTEEERKTVLTSFMYWLQNYNPHDGLVDEFFNKVPNRNVDGKIIL